MTDQRLTMQILFWRRNQNFIVYLFILCIKKYFSAVIHILRYQIHLKAQVFPANLQRDQIR